MRTIEAQKTGKHTQSSRSQPAQGAVVEVKGNVVVAVSFEQSSRSTRTSKLQSAVKTNQSKEKKVQIKRAGRVSVRSCMTFSKQR